MDATVRQRIEDRVRDRCRFRDVAGAAGLEQVLAGRVSPPGCYLYRASVKAYGNGLVNAVSQRLEVTVALVVVVRNVRDARYGDASDESETWCLQLRDALLGWQPGTDWEPMEYGGGRLVSLLNGNHYWQELYRTAGYLRAT